MEQQPRAVGTEYAPDGMTAVDRRHLGIIGQLEVRPEARADGSASVSQLWLKPLPTEPPPVCSQHPGPEYPLGSPPA